MCVACVCWPQVRYAYGKRVVTKAYAVLSVAAHNTTATGTTATGTPATTNHSMAHAIDTALALLQKPEAADNATAPTIVRYTDRVYALSLALNATGSIGAEVLQTQDVSVRTTRGWVWVKRVVQV